MYFSLGTMIGVPVNVFSLFSQRTQVPRNGAILLLPETLFDLPGDPHHRTLFPTSHVTPVGTPSHYTRHRSSLVFERYQDGSYDAVNRVRRQWGNSFLRPQDPNCGGTSTIPNPSHLEELIITKNRWKSTGFRFCHRR